MLKKYHLAINVTFWTLIAAVAVFFTLSQFLPDFNLFKHLSTAPEKTIVEKVPAKVPDYIVQTQYKEIEKKIDWYYFTATGYSSNDAIQGTGQKTATGKNIFKGIIAVDPKIIPYGTKLEIKNIGYFVAEDSGSKIIGNRIDIYFESKTEAQEFGKQGVWVRFVGNNPVEIAQITNNNMQFIK
jgi:3D (Asp-Asp-Asp) domain-containing protein